MEIKINAAAAQTRIQQRAQETKDIRSKHGNNTIVLFKQGTQYLAYEESAHLVAFKCGIMLKQVDGILYSIFHESKLDEYLPRLVKEGYKIAINE